MTVDRSEPGGLAIHEVDMPDPGAHELLVRVSAISLDRDGLARALTSDAFAPVLGSDFSGTVEMATPGSSGPDVGARVAGLVRGGAGAQFVAVPSDAVVELPPKVLFSEAAAMPTAGLTAHYSLEYGGLLAGKRVLVDCGSGAAGLCAVQLAQLSGARVTAATDEPQHDALLV